MSVEIMPKRDIEAKKAEAEIMDILGQHITPDWNRLGELMRIAKW